MDLYLYMSWQDVRMRHNGTDFVLINDKEILNQIWVPDLYFANARTAYFHEVTVHNFNMFISPEGVIAYGTRVTLNLGEFAGDKRVSSRLSNLSIFFAIFRHK
uniref:Neur_chan_LBD domain-containing protein n=1 Tax=Angiostrongylus cantonensis TaxID=6313 RepID=A0A0K0CXX6_ANGCA